MVHGSWMAGLRDGPMDDHEEEGDAARYSREAGAVLGAAHRGCRRGRYCVEALPDTAGCPSRGTLHECPSFCCGLVPMGAPPPPTRNPIRGRDQGVTAPSSIRGLAYPRKKRKKEGVQDEGEEEEESGVG
ncbi:hypothetical protein CCHR01_13582 [Colletotrichum chrysophilum]|uniref:Uncharacterized protein n=1 Tax=Colletotrichum chrysophilum TaxID=1836956 RepID=A0AAD9EAD1_9PEZI|nr:hypothetical protein CCHR01_13582 [Colletotrichum chrysophilum]